MIALAGANLILPDGVRAAGTLIIDGERIAAIGETSDGAPAAAERVDLHGHFILPGFIDVHVHGVLGSDTLDGDDAVAIIARELPRYGVTAFCPTTVACGPHDLRRVLTAVGNCRRSVLRDSARVLPAHLESNFINPEFRGAQPVEYLRGCPRAAAGEATAPARGRESPAEGFGGDDILAEIDRAGADVGIVTLAPEIEGAVDLIRHLVGNGRRVSLGHSGATFEQSLAAVRAGARQATHLFNRMSGVGHREPGLAGAVLASDEVAAEIIGDGVHVHPEIVRLAIRAKGVGRMMAISDGTAAAGLAEGASASLGGRPISVKGGAAYLTDGTLAGSAATMDRVFRFLVAEARCSLSEAAVLCSTTPAAEMGQRDLGIIRVNAMADLVVLDRNLEVRRTYVAGRMVYSR